MFTMSVLINDLMYVLINDLLYVLINDLLYVLINDVMCVLINDVMCVLINDVMCDLINDLMYVLINVLNVSSNIFVEDLITEMAPLLSVDVSIPFQLRSCIHVLCCLLCAWVRKPAFTGVLSYKTAACFNLDQCATLNLTFSTGILRLKCRS